MNQIYFYPKNYGLNLFNFNFFSCNISIHIFLVPV